MPNWKLYNLKMDLEAIILKLQTVELLDFLKSQELNLDDDDFVILKKI